MAGFGLADLSVGRNLCWATEKEGEREWGREKEKDEDRECSRGREVEAGRGEVQGVRCGCSQQAAKDAHHGPGRMTVIIVARRYWRGIGFVEPQLQPTDRPLVLGRVCACA